MTHDKIILKIADSLAWVMVIKGDSYYTKFRLKNHFDNKKQKNNHIYFTTICTDIVFCEISKTINGYSCVAIIHNNSIFNTDGIASTSIAKTLQQAAIFFYKNIIK